MVLKRWVLGLVVAVAVMAVGRYLFGYHLSSVGASSVQGEVLAEQDYPGRRALLVHGPQGWAGRGSCTTGASYCVEAVGGMFSDRRIAKIRLLDQVHDVVGTGHFLFAGVVEKLGAFPSMQAMDAEGKILFEISERTGLEWRAISAP